MELIVFINNQSFARLQIWKLARPWDDVYKSWHKNVHEITNLSCDVKRLKPLGARMICFGIIPAKKENGRWKVFVIKHRLGGHWGFPKGHPKDRHEDGKTNAERELQEETGLSVKCYLPVEPLSENYTCLSHGKWVNKTVIYFIAQVCGEIALCPEETADGAWVDIEEVASKFTFAPSEKFNFPETRQLLKQLKETLQNIQ